MQGDYIEHSMGMFMCISTMAAAGLGNTLSDVLGLGLAHYVERFCEFVGLRPPRLTQEQMELKSSRRVASYVSLIGLLLLLFDFGYLKWNFHIGTRIGYYDWMLVGYVSTAVHEKEKEQPRCRWWKWNAKNGKVVNNEKKELKKRWFTLNSFETLWQCTCIPTNFINLLIRIWTYGQTVLCSLSIFIRILIYISYK